MARKATTSTGATKTATAAPSPTKPAAKAVSKVAKAPATPAAKAAPVKAAKPAAAAKAPAKRGKVKAPAIASITLRQFASAYADEKGMKRAEGIAMIEDIITKIRTHIANGTKVRIQGLGNFEIRDRPARMGRNPATGEAIKIAASRKLVFKPAAELKEAV